MLAPTSPAADHSGVTSTGRLASERSVLLSFLTGCPAIFDVMTQPQQGADRHPRLSSCVDHLADAAYDAVKQHATWPSLCGRIRSPACPDWRVVAVEAAPTEQTRTLLIDTPLDSSRTSSSAESAPERFLQRIASVER